MSDESPERALVLAYAPGDRRAALAALLALDDALALLLRTTREPALGQMRLAWWREALARLDTEPAPAEPVLQGIAQALLPLGVTGASLVPIVHGWEVLIEEEALDADALARFGAGRGALFVAGGRALGATPGDPVEDAGRGWALADLARNLRGAEEAGEARAQAGRLLDEALRQRWSARGRALGALAHLARMDLALAEDAPVPHGAPRRVARLFWHRLTGR
ncbi:MAG: squalene/phytoene synthase family protein [Sphingomonas sp.]|uniref:squalene/phytoene synthase family protein n=1 Tax=Sphingomonas sp. TaxID=28214 RepID=UPI001AFD7979|nr:squalene/phytoene synthase family protein [Sphingomonas sp.]MBO9622801.1 squalene/phytoene synthase family protein [Sphingomonas sp.]